MHGDILVPKSINTSGSSIARKASKKYFGLNPASKFLPSVETYMCCLKIDLDNYLVNIWMLETYNNKDQKYEIKINDITFRTYPNTNKCPIELDDKKL